jgi:hypothetical protein
VQKAIEDFQHKVSFRELARRGFISGIGWAFGVTIGFVLVSTLLVIILNLLGGLPLIGKWIANLVQATQLNLSIRTPIAN